MKIQGFDKNYYSSQSFGSSPKTENPGAKIKNIRELKQQSNFAVLDMHLLDYGTPSKVAFVQDEIYKTTNVMLYNKRGECFYSEEMSDDMAEDAKVLFIEAGLDEETDFVTIMPLKGGLYGKPKQNPFISEKMVDVELLSSKEKAKIMKALFDVEQRELAAKTQLDTPAILDSSSKSYSMSYPTFLVRTLDSGFDMDSVLNNLNISTKNSFKSEDIKRIMVSPDGMHMGIQTFDGKRASLDFNSGSRTVYDSDIDRSGFGTIMIMDKNGPILKR